jgi:LPXTG-site transpeptidase (sortase) family protein
MAQKPTILHIHPEPPKEKKRSKIDWKEFVIDKVKFLGTSLAIFVFSFVALNWSSYQLVFLDKWARTFGEEVESPFEELADVADIQIATTTKKTKPKKEETTFALDVEPEPLRISVLHTNNDLTNKIPALDVDIAPPDTRIIIPRINQNVPIVPVPDEKLYDRDWDGLEEDIQESLKNGVVHYPGTKWPDEGGNFVVTGHSSYYPWDPGRFKDVFVLLNNVILGDRIVVFHNQKKYLYQVNDITEVLPHEVNVLGNTEDDRLTLITCTPIGTNLKRLIVTAEMVK